MDAAAEEKGRRMERRGSTWQAAGVGRAGVVEVEGVEAERKERGGAEEGEGSRAAHLVEQPPSFGGSGEVEFHSGD